VITEDLIYWSLFFLIFGAAYLRCLHLNWRERKGVA
jgi:hypothetical protein